MFKSSLPERTPARGPHERASNAPVTRLYPRGAAGFTLSPSTGGTKTGKSTVIFDVITPERSGKTVAHDLRSEDKSALAVIRTLLDHAAGGLLENSLRSTAFKAAAFTVEEAIDSDSISTESAWFNMYDYLVESDVEAIIGTLREQSSVKTFSALTGIFTSALQKSYSGEARATYESRTTTATTRRTTTAT